MSSKPLPLPFENSNEQAAVEFAITRVGVLQDFLGLVQRDLRKAVTAWMGVDTLPGEEAVETWLRQRRHGQLEAATRADMRLLTNLWYGIAGFRKADVVLRLELLTCLDDAARAAGNELPAGKNDAVARRAALRGAAKLFALVAPTKAPNLTPDDWDRALAAWQRPTGRPRLTDTSDLAPKWKEMVKFARKAKITGVAPATLMEQWAAWKRGGLGTVVYLDDEMPNNATDARSKSHVGVGGVSAKRSGRNPPVRRGPRRT